MWMRSQLLAVFFILASLQGRPQAGILDSTFHNDGIATTGFGNASDFGNATALQPDGKIVVAGASMSTESLDFDFALARYLPNGTLDPTFGNHGLVTTAFGSEDDVINAIAIQPDGKIVVGGSYFNGIGGDFGLARYDPTGALDETFGVNGLAIMDYWAHDAANAIAIQPDGKIVAAGRINDDVHNEFVVVRFHSNGSLDTSFNGDGFVMVDFGDTFDNQWANTILIQPDGKVLVGGGISVNDTIPWPGTVKFFWALARLSPSGYLDQTFGVSGPTFQLGTVYTPMNGTGPQEMRCSALLADGRILCGGWVETDFGLARYHANGTLDNTLSSDGILTTDVTGDADVGTALRIQADGKMILAGHSDNGVDWDLTVVRYNTNGSLDPSFSGDGKLITDISGNHEDAGNGLVLQPDGRMVVAGFTDNGIDNDFALARYNSDGNLDSTFDFDGIVTTDFVTYDAAHAVAVQSNGRIVVAGEAQGDFAVLRYKTNGVLDDGFAYGKGKYVTAIGAFGSARSVAIQPDLYIVLAGETRTGSSSSFALARYDPIGRPDMDFGVSGVVTTKIGTNSGAFGVTSQADEKIVAVGWAYNGKDRDFGLARYHPNGQLDSSFGTNGKVMTNFGSGDNVARAVIVLSDGKILIGGHATYDSQQRQDLHSSFAVARYNPDGTLDNSFSSDGVTTTTLGSDAFGRALAVQPDGKIILAGESDDRFALVRYKPDGNIDGTFGDQGIVTTTLGSSALANGVIAQADNKIVVAGTVDEQFVVVRYNTDGTVDSTFGVAGIASTSIGSSATADATALGLDRKIIVVGSSGMDGDHEVTVVRYLNDLELGILERKTGNNSALVYPNPIASEANLSYELAEEARVTIRVLDQQGRLCQQMANRILLSPGKYIQPINLSELASGTYFIVMSSETFNYAIQVFK